MKRSLLAGQTADLLVAGFQDESGKSTYLLNSVAAFVTESKLARSSSRKMASFPVSIFDLEEGRERQVWGTAMTELTSVMAASALGLDREPI